MTPNTGPSLENLLFDPTLYGLTVLIILISSLAAILALRKRQVAPSQAQGTGLIAIGYVIILVVAISLLALFRAGELGGYQYLQTEFTAVYVGCTTVMYGIDRIVFAREPNHRRGALRAGWWGVFFVSMAIAFAYLLNPLTYIVSTIGATQHVEQELVFWLPPFVTLIAGTVGMPIMNRIYDQNTTTTRNNHSFWLTLFFLTCILGALKESNLIPSLGDPLIDMLVAFIPFSVGSLCIFKSARMLRIQ